MRRCITSLTWCRPTPLGGTQDAFTRRGFGANRDGSIMTNGLRTVLPRSFNAATERVEVLKGPRLDAVRYPRPRRADQRHH
ncbi:TonB-dependent siderophore receptor [Klebsiella pneumoniae]|nr:TonB-dependent siderophore receptor [Klebsiella pneumoniae]